MRKLYLLIAMVSLASLSWAQKDRSETIVTTYLQLPGYDVAQVSPGSIVTEFASGGIGFGAEKLQDVKTMCVKKGGTIKDVVEVNTYYYELPVTQPPSFLVARDADGKIVYADQFGDASPPPARFGYDECANFLVDRVKKQWAEQASSFKAQTMAQRQQQTLDQAQALAQMNVFPSLIREEFELYSAKGKDHDYSDLETAFEKASSAYAAMSQRGPLGSATTELKEAVAIWEKAMEELNVDDKKSRINKQIGKGLAENLANAYNFLYEPQQSLRYGRKALEMYGNITNNRRLAWEGRMGVLETRRLAVDKNEASVSNPERLAELAAAATGGFSPVKQVDAAYDRLAEDFNTFRATQHVETAMKQEEDFREEIEMTGANPYERYVMRSATQGNVLTITPMLMGMGENLTEFPKEVCAMTDLNQITIQNNEIASIPPQIGQLQTVTKMNLANNKLTALPPEIGELTGLKTLNLNGNPLETIPEEIKNCTSLKTLRLKKTSLSKGMQGQLAEWLPNTKIQF